VAAQKVVAEYFHSNLKYRWCESIYLNLLDLFKSEFDYTDSGNKLEAENIDPSLRQLFTQVNLNMQTVLYDSFLNAA
jgi:hypothetical protein